MADEIANSVSFERKTAAKRIELAGTIDSLRSRLAPAQLTREATSELGQLSTAATHAILSKAKSPISISAAGVGVAMAAYFLSQSKPRRSRQKPAAPALGHPAAFVDGETQARRSPAGGVGSVPLLKLAAAVGLGVGLNKLIPVSEKEKQMLHGVGEEVQEAIESWAKEQARRLIHPPVGSPMGVINFLALFVGVLSGANKNRA